MKLFSPLLSRCFVSLKALFALSLFCAPMVHAGDGAFNVKNLNISHHATKTPVELNIVGGDGAEVLIIGSNEEQKKVLSIVGFDESQSETVVLKQLIIPDNIFAYDIGVEQADGLQNLYLLGKDQIYVVDQSLNLASITHTLPNLASMFFTEESEVFIRQDFVNDFNKDKKDDFIIPYFSNVSVWLSNSQGYDYQTLPISSTMEAGYRDYLFRTRKLHFGNFSQQGTLDIALVEHGRLIYYPIKANGKFDSEAKVIELNPDIYGVDWWDVPGNDFDGADHSDVMHRSIVYIGDMNGDDIPDIVVDLAVSESLLSKTNEIEIYFGRLENNKVSYTQQSQSTISTGSTVTPRIIDIDGDDKKEILFTSFKLSLSKIISVLLSGSADIDVFVFSLQDGVYAAKPIVDKEVDMRINLSSGIQRLPLIRMLDIDGDKLDDLVLSDDDDKMKVHLAQNDGNSIYKRRGETFDFDMPSNTDRIIDADVNGDGKKDLVITYTKTDGEDKFNQVSILHAR
jgi:hypothetical protein